MTSFANPAPKPKTEEPCCENCRHSALLHNGMPHEKMCFLSMEERGWGGKSSYSGTTNDFWCSAHEPKDEVTISKLTTLLGEAEARIAELEHELTEVGSAKLDETKKRHEVVECAERWKNRWIEQRREIERILQVEIILDPGQK